MFPIRYAQAFGFNASGPKHFSESAWPVDKNRAGFGAETKNYNPEQFVRTSTGKDDFDRMVPHKFADQVKRNRLGRHIKRMLIMPR
jgi:hypothetical protein